jgi:N-acetylglutamate synthase/N-acetylornithine aminotransferase
VTSARSALARWRRRRHARHHDRPIRFQSRHAIAHGTPQGTIPVGGMAKGSGMIEPRMATMLGFLTTDAACRSTACSARRCARVAMKRSTRSRSTASARRTTACSRWRQDDPDVTIERDDDPRLIEPMRAVPDILAREIVRGGEGATQARHGPGDTAPRHAPMRGWRRGRSPTRRW